MLTARDAEVDRVLGLEVGADDYVTKPFSLAELVARARAIMRRRNLDLAERRSVVDVGGLAIDFERHEVKVDGRTVRMTLSEMKLLTLLAGHPASWLTPAGSGASRSGVLAPGDHAAPLGQRAHR